MNFDKRALDRHITGNYGEDQFKREEEGDYLVRTLRKISAIPVCAVDARNTAGLEVARSLAREAIARYLMELGED